MNALAKIFTVLAVVIAFVVLIVFGGLLYLFPFILIGEVIRRTRRDMRRRARARARVRVTVRSDVPQGWNPRNPYDGI